MKLTEALFVFVAFLAFIAVIVGVGSGQHIKAQNRFTEALGYSIESIESLKQDCEKSLPRDQECVMIWEFVPVTKEKEE